MRLTPLLPAMLALLLPAAAAAQSVRVGTVLQTFNFDDAAAVGIGEAQLLTVPVELAWVLPYAWLRVEGGYADGIVTYPGGGYTTLSGATDTRLMVGSSVSVVAVRALGILPSGDSRYAPGEVTLVGVLASELLPFAIESWGGGGAIGGEAEVAGGRGRWAFGLVGGYMVSKAHAPFESADLSYRPGDQARLRLTIASRMGSASSVGLIAGYQHPTLESYGDRDLYQPGDRWEAELAFAHPFGARESVSLRAGVHERSHGILTVPAVAAGEILPGIVDSAERRLFYLGADLQLTRGELVIVPEGELRVLRTGDGVGEGWVSTLGVSADRRIVGLRRGPRLVGSARARLHVGSIATARAGSTSVRGWEINLAARLERG